MNFRSLSCQARCGKAGCPWHGVCAWVLGSSFLECGGLPPLFRLKPGFAILLSHFSRASRGRSVAFYVISPDCHPACPACPELRGERSRRAAAFPLAASSPNCFHLHEGCPRHGVCAWVLGLGAPGSIFYLGLGSAFSRFVIPPARRRRDRSAAHAASPQIVIPLAPNIEGTGAGPGSFSRAAFWRVGPRSAGCERILHPGCLRRGGGIPAPLLPANRHGDHPAPLPRTPLMLFSVQFSRSGGTGRRSRLKICRGSLPVWVRLPPPGPPEP